MSKISLNVPKEQRLQQQVAYEYLGRKWPKGQTQFLLEAWTTCGILGMGYTYHFQVTRLESGHNVCYSVRANTDVIALTGLVIQMERDHPQLIPLIKLFRNMLANPQHYPFAG